MDFDDAGAFAPDMQHDLPIDLPKGLEACARAQAPREMKLKSRLLPTAAEGAIVLPDLLHRIAKPEADLWHVDGGGYEMAENEISVDLFCGAGGTSTGISDALLESPAFALNHNPVAIGVHDANHPDTIHLLSDAFAMDPAVHVPADKAIGLLTASPSCVHFSTARGGKPLDKEIRDQAWVVCNWAEHPNIRFRPRMIMVENVREFLSWAPLNDKNKIDKRYIDKNGLGSTFKEWRDRIVTAGYHLEYWILNAADYGVATKRKRLIIVARRDGLPIRKPEATHAPRKSPEVERGEMLPYDTAANHIDFTIHTNPIFMYPEDAKKAGAIRPLADNTLKRVAAGIERYVIDADEPYIIPYYGAKAGEKFRGKPVSEPLPTQTVENRFALINPMISPITHTGPGRYYGMGTQLPTLTCAKRGELALISPICAGQDRREGDGDGAGVVIPMRRETLPVDITGPIPSLATHAQMSLAVGRLSEVAKSDVFASPILVGAGGGEYAGKPRTVDAPAGTITCHMRSAIAVPALVRVAHGDVDKNGKRRGQGTHDVEEPLPTQSTSNEFAVATASLSGVGGFEVAAMVQTGYGEREGQAPRCLDVLEPIGTFVAGGGKHAVVAASLIRTDMHKSNASCTFDILDPANTFTTSGGFALVEASMSEVSRAAFVTNNNTNRLATSAQDPVPAMTTGNQQIVTEVGLSAVHLGQENYDDRGHDVREPFTTMTLSPHHSVVRSCIAAIHIGQNNTDRVGLSAQEPLTTMTQTPQQVVVKTGMSDLAAAAFMGQNNTDKVGHPVTDPVSTMTTNLAHQSVVTTGLAHIEGLPPHATAVHMAQQNEGNVGHDVREPVSTMTTKVCHQNLVASHIVTFRQNTDGQSVEDPVPTFCAEGNHVGEVRTSMVTIVKYYGQGGGQMQDAGNPLDTLTAKARFAVVNVPIESLGLTEEQRYEAWWIARFLEIYGTRDQGKPETAHLSGPRPSLVGRPGAVIWTVEMRMLKPKEAFSASSFPKDFKFDRMSNGKATTISQQMALVGNAVPPGLAKAVISANLKPRMSLTRTPLAEAA